MYFYDDIFDNDENPQAILIEELRRSNKFFQILSETLNDPYYREQADEAIEKLSDIEKYISNCNIYQLEELLARMNNF